MVERSVSYNSEVEDNPWALDDEESKSENSYSNIELDRQGSYKPRVSPISLYNDVGKLHSVYSRKYFRKNNGKSG